MTDGKRNFLLALFCIVLIFFIHGAVYAQDTVIITGRVNGDYQIITEKDEVYEIGENSKGDELVQLVGRIVEVKGHIIHEEDYLVIMATDYKVIK